VKHPDDLPRRERQLLDALYELREASAVAIRERMADAPSDSAVRAMLTRLEAKGLVTHREEGGRYLYTPKFPKNRARDEAISKLVRTFFDGSASRAASTLLGISGNKLSSSEIAEFEAMLDRAKKGRQ
jgi:predicted transcriptional regulator